MPKHVQAREAQDEQEERQVRKLAQSYHAPADGKFHAQMVVESWAGKTPNEIASKLDGHPQTVRIHLARFNVQGVDGLGMREGAGRKPRLTEQERSKILGLVKQPPPGRLERYAETLEARDEEGSAPGWSSNGHRMKAPLEYSRGDDEVWISGALRVRDMSSFLKAPVG